MNFCTRIATRKDFIQSIVLTAGLSIGMPLAALAGASPSVAPPAALATWGADPEACMALAPAAAAMKAYIDPVTGQFVASPLAPQDDEPVTTWHDHMPSATEALVEEPAPGGGVQLKLDDSFFSSSTATKDQDGNISISHTPLPRSK